MKFGKHTDEAFKIRQLEERIKLKDIEIKNIKTECAEQFKKIKELCVCNSYNEKLDKLRKNLRNSLLQFFDIIKRFTYKRRHGK